jgi:general secretion pathway protein D
VFGSLRNSNGLPATPDPSTVTTAVNGGLQLLNLTPAGTLRAVLNTLGQDGRATLESAPKILVLDNQKAVINVGDRISVATGTTVGSGTGGNTVNTFQYVDTGILLTVTPRINAGGRVTLDISQEVSSVPPNRANNANPDISTRKAQTVINVASGETIPLGGLIRKNRNTSSAGVPLLSKIPVIGGIFGRQTFSYERTELIVLITPKVVASNEDSREMTEELRDKLPALKHLIPTAKENGAPKKRAEEESHEEPGADLRMEKRVPGMQQ